MPQSLANDSQPLAEDQNVEVVKETCFASTTTLVDVLNVGHQDLERKHLMQTRPITNIAGKVIYVPGDDISTVQIFPARFLSSPDDLDEHVFGDDRERTGKKHPFTKLRDQGHNILVADCKFGIGPNQDYAVTALKGWGIDAVVASHFDPQFKLHALTSGLVCVEVAEEDQTGLLQEVRRIIPSYLQDRDKDLCLVIDLLMRRIFYDSRGRSDSFGFTIEQSDREKLIAGTWDTVGTDTPAKEPRRLAG